ncbi:serine protease inhibitor Kazal-type 5 [Elgaria multicarinata webbii]|uniref:serine protease inhibitor Kazal-type 5 n=1 Tax=Elgaria multicarinata webbii TaxID=159646 RepID=UPI002FCCEB96
MVIQDECSRWPKPIQGCTRELNPVCGTNGVTYDNKCLLCLERQMVLENGIGIVLEDECSQLPRQLSGCTTVFAPVCGSNGVTYNNECLLCSARQDTGEDVQIKHGGKCKEKDECSELLGPEKGYPPVCSLYYWKFCGSDGRTYQNKCEFCDAKRKSGGTLEIEYEGECVNKVEDECSEFREIKKGYPVMCILDHEKVCGTDGVTYPNKCEFCVAKKNYGGALEIHYEGECENVIKDECSEFRKMKKGYPLMCILDHEKVCGSDGVTYPNKCEFCVAKKNHGGTLEIRYEGECENEIKPDICSKHPKMKPCNNEHKPVCSTSGVTFANKCLFCEAWRKYGGTFDIRNDEECEKEDKCKHLSEAEQGESAMCPMDYNPICGSNGVTYGNLCVFCYAKRKSKGDLTIIHEGGCKKKPDICSEYPETEQCKDDHKPICCTKGVTYINKCFFCVAWRKHGGTFEIQSEGECEKQASSKYTEH